MARPFIFLPPSLPLPLPLFLSPSLPLPLESGENYLHFAMAEATLHKLIDVELRELEGTVTRTVTALEAELGHTWPLESDIKLCLKFRIVVFNWN